jgi:hypothetical protein
MSAEQTKKRPSRSKAAIEARNQTKLNENVNTDLKSVFFLCPHGIKVTVREGIVIDSKPVYAEAKPEERFLTVEYQSDQSISIKKIHSNEAFETAQACKDAIDTVNYSR